MTALPADVSAYTNDGVVISTDAAAGAQIKAVHQNARDGFAAEIEMFYDNPADAQIMLNEKFLLVSQINPPHIGVEIEDDIGFGETVPVTPTVPCYELVDESRNQDIVARVRSYGHDSATDRFSLEMLV